MTGAVIPEYVMAAKRLARRIGFDERETILLAEDIRALDITSEGVRAVIGSLRSGVLNRAIDTLPQGYTRKMVWAAIRRKADFDRKAWSGVLPEPILEEAYGLLQIAGTRKRG